MMHLIFYAPRFYPAVGGLEKVIRVWALALTQMGHRVIVITQTEAAPADDVDFPFKVMRLASPNLALKTMRKATVVVQFDVSLKGLLPCLLSGKPIIISHHTALWHTGAAKPWRQRLKAWVSNNIAKNNICCSQFIAQQFKRSAVVHSPYEANLFYPQDIQRTPKSILYVGRLVSIKGVHLLLEALHTVQQQGIAFTCTIIGTGPHQTDLEIQAKAVGLQHITWAGVANAQQVALAMNSHQILVVPSLQEPFGTVVPEGLACGMQVISSGAGGLPEAGGGCTTIVQPFGSKALAAEIVQALGASFNNNGVQQHLHSLTVEATATAFLQHIKNTIDSNA